METIILTVSTSRLRLMAVTVSLCAETRVRKTRKTRPHVEHHRHRAGVIRGAGESLSPGPTDLSISYPALYLVTVHFVYFLHFGMCISSLLIVNVQRHVFYPTIIHFLNFVIHFKSSKCNLISSKGVK